MSLESDPQKMKTVHPYLQYFVTSGREKTGTQKYVATCDSKFLASYLMSSGDSAQTMMLLSDITKRIRQLQSRPGGGVTSVTFH